MRTRDHKMPLIGDMSVKQLKEELRKFQAKVSGRKKELVERNYGLIDEMESSKENNQNLEDMIAQFTSPGITDEKVRRVYEVWAETYDQDVGTDMAHNGPLYTVKFLSRYLEKRKGSRILDAAPGTGRVGSELRKQGYDNIDALDGSSAMLDQAKKKGIYKHFICDLLGKNRLNIDDDTYDAVVTSASFVPGHLNDECFEELLRIVKPGGYFVLVMRELYLMTYPVFKERLEPRMQFLQDQRAWRQLVKEKIPKYHEEEHGVVYVFQMLEEKHSYLTTL